MAKRRRPDVNVAPLPGYSTPRNADAAVVSYAGDKPNPDLRRFVQEHATPYDPETDAYDIPAFNQPIETTKATAIYNMHVYWSKKPHTAIRQYIRHYTQPGDIVLDPFCGSGGTALAALLDGRRAIAIDRSPAATFIAKNHCTPVDPEALRSAFQKVKRAIRDEIDWLYATRCDRCGGKATTGYTVYSQVFQCPRCLVKIPLYNCGTEEVRTAAGKPKKVNVCPHCKANGFIEVIRSQGEKFGFVPVKVVTHCEAGCKPARDIREHDDPSPEKRAAFEKDDLGKIREIESREIPHWFPPHHMMNVEDDSVPWGDKWRAGTSSFRTIADLFTKRNLWALATIRDAILKVEDAAVRDALMFALSGITLNTTKMCQDRDKLGFNKGTYYIPQIFRELVVTNSLDYKVQNHLATAFDETAGIKGTECSISTQSSTDLSAIPANSLDYIFTDPPYAEKVQYGELNFVWESWLGFDTRWHDEEIIVNDVRGITEADWADRMRRVMAECYRVLKPGRWLSLCYHDTSEGTWALVQDVMAEVGFVVDRSESTLFIDTGQKSYNQLTADKATKRDLVLNFRKPKAGEYVITRTVDGRSFSEVAVAVIRDYLTNHPGATKDRIYDEVVSRLIQAGKMEAHDFNALLHTVAEEVRESASWEDEAPAESFHREGEAPAEPSPTPARLGGSLALPTHRTLMSSRWYLKETADEVDQAEQEKEDAAAARLEGFIGEHLQKHPEDEGVHYTNLQEEFFNIPTVQWPRRRLFDWLPEYFFKTPAGTWRPPATDEERAQKAALRQSGTLRRIKRFANALIDGVPVREKDRPGRDRTLADWIRQCRRAGLFEQGRALYEKGGLNLDRLNEVEQIEVEDDYRTCARRGSAAEAKPRRKRRNTDDE